MFCAVRPVPAQAHARPFPPNAPNRQLPGARAVGVSDLAGAPSRGPTQTPERGRPRRAGAVPCYKTEQPAGRAAAKPRCPGRSACGAQGASSPVRFQPPRSVPPRTAPPAPRPPPSPPAARAAGPAVAAPPMAGGRALFGRAATVQANAACQPAAGPQWEGGCSNGPPHRRPATGHSSSKGRKSSSSTSSSGTAAPLLMSPSALSSRRRTACPRPRSCRATRASPTAPGLGWTRRWWRRRRRRRGGPPTPRRRRRAPGARRRARSRVRFQGGRRGRRKLNRPVLAVPPQDHHQQRCHPTAGHPASWPARSALRPLARACAPAGTVLLGQSAEALRQLASSLGQKPYRGQQVYEELLRGARNPELRGARSVEELVLVPKVRAACSSAVCPAGCRLASGARSGAPLVRTRELLGATQSRPVVSWSPRNPDRAARS